MKIQKEIEYVNSHIIENLVKYPISNDQNMSFHSFTTTFSKLQTTQVKYLPELLIMSKSTGT